MSNAQIHAGMLKKPLRTVLLLQDLEFGGTQRYATHLAKHLDKELFDLEVWVLRRGEDMLPLAEVPLGKVRYFCQNSWVTPAALGKLFVALRRNPPDIIYTLTVVPNIWGRLFSYLLGVPVIVTSWRSRKQQQFESFLWRMSNRIICNSEAIRQFLLARHAVDPSRAVVIPNGVDTDYFTPDHSQKASVPTVLYLGRMARIKDPMNALVAFHLLSSKAPDARMIMMGNGGLRSTLEEYVRTHDLAERVEIRRGSTDVRPMLRKAWLLVVSSISEGFPNVILEAMACGAPVVATAVGGNPEAVRAGITGLLVPPRDPQAMANAMQTILSDHGLRETMGAQARRIAVEEYSIDTITGLTQKALLDAACDAVVRKKRSELIALRD
ncbi:MAG: glycosyltransferase family 4 protein [Desulfomonilaceae bacterium]